MALGDGDLTIEERFFRKHGCDPFAYVDKRVAAGWPRQAAYASMQEEIDFFWREIRWEEEAAVFANPFVDFK